MSWHQWAMILPSIVLHNFCLHIYFIYLNFQSLCYITLPIRKLWHFPVIRLLIEAEWRIYALVISTNIGADNGLTPGRHITIIWTNGGCLFSNESPGPNFRVIWTEIATFFFTQISSKCRLQKHGHFIPALICHIRQMSRMYIVDGNQCSVA